MSRKIFGTDGVRGLANLAPMDPETALALGRAIAYVFKGKGGRHHRIVIGKDTRLSGYMIENALSAGICSMGAEAIFLGPMPTPGIAFITQAMRADAGVVISASHNSYHDNGIKFFDHNGYKLADEIEIKMEALLQEDSLKKGATHEGVGRAYRVDDAKGRYIEYLKTTFPKHLSLEGLKIVLDCAHGAAYKIAPMVFEELGAEVIALSVQPNGININENCGALHPQALQKAVQEQKANIGFAFDGDADRLVVVDQDGEILHGDVLLAIFARFLNEHGKLAKRSLVATVMSNIGLELALREQEIGLIRTSVGDRYVIEAMRQEGFNLGGEQSGHIIFNDYSTTGDGILAALQLMAVLREKEKSLAELAKGIIIFPQVLLNISVKNRRDLNDLPSLMKLQKQIESHLGKRGRLLIRYSGTETLLRIMIEGENLSQIQNYAAEIASEAKACLNH